MGTDSSGDSPSPSEAVLREIAEDTGVRPEAMNPPLYDVVDPDALDSVLRGDTGHVTFEFHGYVVTVDHAGAVDLEPLNTD